MKTRTKDCRPIFVNCLVAVGAAAMLLSCAPDPAGGADVGLISRPATVDRPILDTHIHLYQVTRAGGVPWPPPSNTTLFFDSLPAGYQAMAQPLGITGTGVVEASPLNSDT